MIIPGNMYFYGDSVNKDYYLAVKWYRKAAELGDFKSVKILKKLDKLE